MSTHDMNIANQGFPAFRADLNNALAALVSNSSSATEPTTTFAYQFWADTTNDLLKQRNAANDGWVSILTLSTGAPVNVTNDAITEGNSSLSVIDTGTGYISLVLDGVEVGKLINNSGVATALILDPRANGASIWGGSNAIYPGNQSSQSDGLLSLGSSTNRFKELYLSGGVYLGGTGSANYLDDYEEGTWTPTIVGAYTSPTYVDTAGYYTKVGRLITFTGRLEISNATATTGTFAIGNLPFTALSGVGSQGSCSVGYCNVAGLVGDIYTLYINEANNKITFFDDDDTGVTSSEMADTAFTIHFSGHYYIT